MLFLKKNHWNHSVSKIHKDLSARQKVLKVGTVIFGEMLLLSVLQAVKMTTSSVVNDILISMK